MWCHNGPDSMPPRHELELQIEIKADTVPGMVSMLCMYGKLRSHTAHLTLVTLFRHSHVNSVSSEWSQR